MRRRKLPPQLRLAPALLATAGVLMQAHAVDLPVIAPPEPALQQVRQALPAGAKVDVALDVGGDGSGRLVFGTLRTDAALSSLTLLDPQGRAAWRHTPAELGLVPRGQTPQPELGDAIPLPEVQQPMPGRWLLRLERAGPAPAAGRLLLTYRLLPRFSLGFWKSPASLAAGQPLLLTLRPTDMGRPVQQPALLELQVLPQGPGAAPQALQARQDLAGPTGARISTEPGAYLAQWRAPQPGRYDIHASWQPAGSTTPLVAVQHIDVTAAAAQLHFTGMKAEGIPGCVRTLVLGFAVQLDTPPPAAAVHSLAVRLRGAAQSQQLSTSVALEGRLGNIELRLSPATLRSLGWPLQRIESSQLTRFTPELKVLTAGEPVELAALLPPAALCP